MHLDFGASALQAHPDIHPCSFTLLKAIGSPLWGWGVGELAPTDFRG